MSYGKQKSICILVSNDNGGFGTFVDNMLVCLKRADVHTTILSFSNFHHNYPFKTERRLVPKAFFQTSRKPFFWLYVFQKMKQTVAKIMHFPDRFGIFYMQYSAARWALSYPKTLDLSEFDVVFSSEEGLCNYFLAKKIIAKKKIGIVHPDYRAAHFNKTIDSFFLADLDCVCSVSQSGSQILRKAFPRIKHKICAIRPPLLPETIVERSKEHIDLEFDRRVLNIVTVCRLDNVSKALDRLMKLAEGLKNDGQRFVWRIVGTGPYREAMIRELTKTGLQKNIILVGHTANPMPYIANSDLFVLQSYYEGFPLTVCESQILGTPVLITNYSSSGEQVIDGETGFIVQNSFGPIFAKLRYLFNNRNELVRVRHELMSKSKDRYADFSGFLDVLFGPKI